MACLIELKKTIAQKFPDKAIRLIAAHDELTLEVSACDCYNVCLILRDELKFEMLMDVCGVDYLTYGVSDWETTQATDQGFSRGVAPGILNEHDKTAPKERFAVVYHLLSIANNVRLRVRAFVNEALPMIRSVNAIWASANWFEREAFDLYGILFDGHPDLRRILTDYGFIGHPFRKDFPLSGHVEVRYDAAQKRVIYETVDIKPRILVPKVIRHDNRYQTTSAIEGGQ